MQYNTKEMKWFKKREIDFAKNLLFYIFRKDIFEDFSSTKKEKDGILICKPNRKSYKDYSRKTSKKGLGICDICLGCMHCHNERDYRFGFYGIWAEYHDVCDMGFISDIFWTLNKKKQWYKKTYIDLFWNNAKEHLVYKFMWKFNFMDICGVCLKTIKKEINKVYKKRKEINKLLLILWMLEWYVESEIGDISVYYHPINCKFDKVGSAEIAKKILVGVRQRIFDILKENKNKSLL